MNEQPFILVADDDEDILTFVVPTLHAAGYRVRSARTGLEALRMLVGDEFEFDLGILDIGMPGLDGTAVCRILKAKGDSAPPVMFLTARAHPSERSMGLQAGAVDYVVKPFEMTELLARVSLALRAHRRTA